MPRIEYHGSIVLLFPENDSELAWLEENVDAEAQWWAGALVVEPRYLESLLAGMINAKD